jgi:hypothetical protein
VARVTSPESSRFEPTPGALRWGWILWFVWLVIGGELLLRDLAAGGAGAISVVLVAPLWLIWLLWLLWRAWTRIGPAPQTRWHGNWFEFDGTPVRVLFEDETILLAADDVFDAFGLKGHARDPERVRAIAGRDSLVPRGAGGLRDTPFFTERGLRAWLERRTDAQAAKFVRWYETQVVAPYRRRRELAGDGA